MLPPAALLGPGPSSSHTGGRAVPVRPAKETLGQLGSVALPVEGGSQELGKHEKVSRSGPRKDANSLALFFSDSRAEVSTDAGGQCPLTCPLSRRQRSERKIRGAGGKAAAGGEPTAL